MKNIIKFIVKDIENDQRVDLFLSNNKKELSRTRVKNLILNQRLLINEKICTDPSKKVSENDNIKLEIPEPQKASLEPFDFKLNVIYEDKDLMVINKPAGISMHPGAGDYNKTLVNALIFYDSKNLSTIGDELRPGIVHRIDKDTSGLLVVAKNNFTHADLGRQFSKHSIKRKYIALIWGVLRPLQGTIETFITRSKRNRQLMTTDDFKGKKAITKYSIIKVFNKKDIPKVSLIEFELKTGRTHQIRVHMIYKGTSLLGDQKYRKRNVKFKKIDTKFEKILSSFKGQVLHASTLGFDHPRSLKKVEFKTKLPLKFKKLVDYLESLRN